MIIMKYIYSIIETARANGLNVYYYIKYLLEKLVTLIDEQGNIEQSRLEPLMPWSKAYLMIVVVNVADKRRLNLMESVRFDAYVFLGLKKSWNTSDFSVQ